MDVVLWVLRAGLVAWLVALFISLIIVSVLVTVWASESIKTRVWDARTDDAFDRIERLAPRIRNRP